MGPLFFGWMARHGGKEQVWQNMSDAMAWCGAIYLVGAVLLLAAMVQMMRRRPR